jgi:hypothetical protein
LAGVSRLGVSEDVWSIQTSPQAIVLGNHISAAMFRAFDYTFGYLLNQRRKIVQTTATIPHRRDQRRPECVRRHISFLIAGVRAYLRGRFGRVCSSE